jgi:hypothetical protein
MGIEYIPGHRTVSSASERRRPTADRETIESTVVELPGSVMIGERTYQLGYKELFDSENQKNGFIVVFEQAGFSSPIECSVLLLGSEDLPLAHIGFDANPCDRDQLSSEDKQQMYLYVLHEIVFDYLRQMGYTQAVHEDVLPIAATPNDFFSAQEAADVLSSLGYTADPEHPHQYRSSVYRLGMLAQAA